MVYFDTNVYVYAFCQNVDNPAQKELSQSLLKQSVSNHELILSEMILYEFAFVSKKLEEETGVIQNNLEFLSRYAQPTHGNILKRVLEIFEYTSLYRSAFDVFHLAYSESLGCKLITFDKGFKKLKAVAKTEIEILP
jgi:predicted nucleic acid-binding protein